MMTTRNSLQSAGQSGTSNELPTLSSLANTATHHVDGAALDYLCMEMVKALRASSALATARLKAYERKMIEGGLLPPPPPPPVPKDTQRDSTSSMSSKFSIGRVSLDAEEEELRLRLEAIGVHVGSNMAERLCRDRQRFSDTLDAIKFICKDLWNACWDKQVDNLRTNHRGVYVLQDNAFKPLLRISSFEGQIDALRRARIYVAMPAGIIKGALERIGYHGNVVAELTTLPQYQATEKCLVEPLKGQLQIQKRRNMLGDTCSTDGFCSEIRPMSIDKIH